MEAEIGTLGRKCKGIRLNWPALVTAGGAVVRSFPPKARRRLIGVDTSGFGVIVGNIWATNLIPEADESSPTVD